MNRASEYKELQPNSDLRKRKDYWEVAKGLQETDGLQTSEYLETVIADTINGKYGTSKAERKILAYYEELDPNSPEYETKEADIVSARITAYLETDDFKFSPVLLKSIHRNLFQDILPYKWVGVYRTVNISKSEDVLNGSSVQYANYSEIQDYLAYDFGEEQKVQYNLPFTEKQIEKLTDFTSRIWQTHPFREGNTRTITTFLLKYLHFLGVNINNGPFKIHAKWFRDALVRSNYTNLSQGIQPDFVYLKMFFENILIDANHQLNKYNLYIKQ